MKAIYGDGNAEWKALLAQLPAQCQDVYFRPEYHDLHAANGDGFPFFFSAKEGPAEFLIPGLRVPIPLTYRSSSPASYWDLQSCNGYGGPLASPEASTQFLKSAWTQWKIWALENKIVAGFFRLHPLVDNARWLPADAQVILDRHTVFVDLSDGLEQVWLRADSRHRNMVNKGRREGINVQWDAPGDWDEFESLYGASMHRLGAPQALRFSAEYFTCLRKLPGTRLACVRQSDMLAAAAVFMFGPCWAHYHLSARLEGSGNHLTNVILQAAIERAAAAGLQGLHLGGGRTRDPNDTLLRFKNGLGGRLLDFKVALVVTDKDTYGELCSRWARDVGNTPDWLLGYRQPQPLAKSS